MLSDTLSPNPDSLGLSISKNHFGFDNFWLWVSIVEFAIILYLVGIRIIKEREARAIEIPDVLKKSKAADIDMDNLMNSINISRALYKELSRSCHPDNFINSDKEKIAQGIFQEITRNKRDYGKLQELATRARNELELTINHP